MGDTSSASHGSADTGNGAKNNQELLPQTSPSMAAVPAVVPAILLTTGIVGGILVLTVPFVLMPLCGHSLPFMATPAVKVKKALQFIQKRQQQRQQVLVVPSTKALDLTLESASSTRRRMFLDLGSGDGEAVWQAAQLHSGDDKNDNDRPASSARLEEHKHYHFTDCVGVELNSTLYLVSVLRRALFWSHPIRQRSRFYCRDVWALPRHLVREADTIFLFGIPSLMPRLSHAMAHTWQIRSGTFIVSYRFPLPVRDGTSKSVNATDILPIKSESNRVSEELPFPLLEAELVYSEDEMRIYECTANDDTLPNTFG
jgi:hypothetical protein